MDQKDRIKLLELEQIVGIISAGLLIAAAFIPWGRTANVTILGIEGNDSKLTIAIGLIALVVLLIRKAPTIIALILGIAALLTGFYDYQQMALATSQMGGTVGTGLYLTILAANAVIICSVIDMIRNRKAGG